MEKLNITKKDWLSLKVMVADTELVSLKPISSGKLPNKVGIQNDISYVGDDFQVIDGFEYYGGLEPIVCYINSGKLPDKVGDVFYVGDDFQVIGDLEVIAV